ERDEVAARESGGEDECLLCDVSRQAAGLEVAAFRPWRNQLERKRRIRPLHSRSPPLEPAFVRGRQSDTRPLPAPGRFGQDEGDIALDPAPLPPAGGQIELLA